MHGRVHRFALVASRLNSDCRESFMVVRFGSV